MRLESIAVVGVPGKIQTVVQVVGGQAGGACAYVARKARRSPRVLSGVAWVTRIPSTDPPFPSPYTLTTRTSLVTMSILAALPADYAYVAAVGTLGVYSQSSSRRTTCFNRPTH